MSQPLSVGSLHKVSLSGNLYFPSSLLLVSGWFPSWQPQVSSGFHVVSWLATPGFQWFLCSFLAGNPRFPVVSTGFPIWQPQVSSGFHGVSCWKPQVSSGFHGVSYLATPGFQWFPRGFLLETSGFQWFPRGFHSGIWAVSAFHGMETMGKQGVAGMETRWKPRVNPGFPAGFL